MTADNSNESARPSAVPAEELLRALVIDDEEMIRDVSSIMLEELGFEIVTVASGEEALQLFQTPENRFDVVLLDQTMPGMDGATVLRELRRIRPALKVILTSGYSQHEVSKLFNGLELNGCLSKPYNLKDLTSEITRVLAERTP